MNSCVVMCPCCGTILEVTSNGNVIGSSAYPVYSNMQMSLRDMIQYKYPDYPQVCCTINKEENDV